MAVRFGSICASSLSEVRPKTANKKADRTELHIHPASEEDTARGQCRRAKSAFLNLLQRLRGQNHGLNSIRTASAFYAGSGTGLPIPGFPSMIVSVPLPATLLLKWYGEKAGGAGYLSAVEAWRSGMEGKSRSWSGCSLDGGFAAGGTRRQGQRL